MSEKGKYEAKEMARESAYLEARAAYDHGASAGAKRFLDVIAFHAAVMHAIACYDAILSPKDTQP